MSSKQQTHSQIDPRLVGFPIKVVKGTAVVTLVATADMAADQHNLVHGGFVFGLADYAAMLAINHPNVVLGAAQVRFLKPVVVGDALAATAKRGEDEGKKQFVEVEVKCGDELVFTGTFTCFSPEKHVLEGRAESAS